MAPRSDEAARVGFFPQGSAGPTEISITPNSAGDYGLDSSGGIDDQGLSGIDLTLWGVPADSSHDTLRVPCLTNAGTTTGGSCPADYPPAPFLTNPTKCDGPDLVTTLNVDFWGDIGDFQTATSSTAPPVDCQELPFDPSLSLTPSTTRVDEPTGLEADVHVPQNGDPNSVSTSALEQAVVTLPAGLTLSPSAATRLAGCTDAELGLGSNAAASCPAESQVGTTEIDTPLLPTPIYGTLYLGTPLNNDPTSGQMYRIFQVASGYGMTIKLVGNVVANPVTGQLTATFSNLPQVPFEDFKMFFNGGSTAPLANSLTCQANTTTSDFTPYALNGDQYPTSSFATTLDGQGAACPAVVPFAPQLSAGSSSTQAGADTGFLLSLTRPDGNQYLSGLTVTTPPGIAARLPAAPLCPLAESAAGTCPNSSQIGTVQALSGTGSAPLALPGSVYLAQPSVAGDVADLSIVVPAIAGPYNLGDVVVLAHVHVNPTDAQLTVTSDPLPTILDGIPLRIHEIEIDIDHPGFMVNPTSCDPTSITAAATSTAGATANPTSRLQVGGCQNLAFKPALTASTQGNGTTKGHGASLDVKIAAKQGPGFKAGEEEANIAKVDTQLPLALSSRLTTLQKACTEGQFAANPAGCPAGAFVGTATATTPLLSAQLTGPAILVSHGGAAFPDLVLLLQGEGVEIELVGNTQIKNGITYSKFETVPDAPVSSFELNLPEKEDALLGAITNLCKPTKSVTVEEKVTVKRHGKKVKVTKKVTKQVAEALVMPTTIAGQNGAVVTQSTKIGVTGCTAAKPAKKPAKKKKKKKGKGKKKAKK